MAAFEVRSVLAIKAELGEAAMWSVEEQALFWVDILKATFNRFDPISGSNQVLALPAKPGCFALRDGGTVIATAKGYYDLDFASGALTFLLDAPFGEEFRFNDGKPDRQGRFWAGTVFEHEFRHDGAFFRFEGGVAQKAISNITVANGVAFSPDGRKMYRAESMSGEIFVLDYDPETGAASNQRVFAVYPKEMGIPDGATVDSDGYYWSAATFGEKAGHVLRFTPDGALDLKIEMPVLLPTMVAFGGRDLSTLYVTSGCIEHQLGRASSDLSGNLFAIETPFRGIPEAKYNS